MEFNIEKIRQKWHFLRYIDDFEDKNDLNFQQNYIKNYFFKNGLLINNNSSRKINKIITSVCERLSFSRNNLNVFVYSSSEIQGGCYPITPAECLIQLSSGLINLMNETELAFVISHELGHFIFNHGVYKEGYSQIEKFMKMRSQEISVDRIGLIGCDDLNASMSAMIKTLSGLNEDYLDMNISDFINQARLIEKNNIDNSYLETHPSIVLRCRALLLLSTSGILKTVNYETLSLKKINKSIKKELELYIDNPIKKRLDECIENYKIWKSLEIILIDKKFDKTEQEKFGKKFGDSILKKVLNYILSSNMSEVGNFIEQKLLEEQKNLQNLNENDFKTVVEIIDKELVLFFNENKG